MDDAIAALDSAIAAFNDRNYALYEGLLTDDIEAYTGVNTPLRFVGKASWMEFIRDLDDFESVSYERRHPAYRMYNDDVVISNAYFVFSTVPKSGEQKTQTGRESTAIVKVDGSWRIANFHFSAMF